MLDLVLGFSFASFLDNAFNKILMMGTVDTILGTVTAMSYSYSKFACVVDLLDSWKILL